MREQGRHRTFVQCQNCGNLYTFPHIVAIDKMYISSYCPECGATTALNLGNNEGDRYELYDVNIDPRYYEYDQQYKMNDSRR